MIVKDKYAEAEFKDMSKHSTTINSFRKANKLGG